jgi:putative membrane protein
METTVQREVAEKRAKIFIWVASLAIPIVVAILYVMPKIPAGEGALRDFLNYLPLFNALCNGSTAVILVLALVAIKKKNMKLHRNLMTSALGLSLLFLVSYVGYHATSESTLFPKDNPMKWLYYIILLTHISISAIIVPLVLISYSRALAQRYDKHRKIAKITWPLWFYVAVTGVIVYLMISPYYGF